MTTLQKLVIIIAKKIQNQSKKPHQHNHQKTNQKFQTQTKNYSPYHQTQQKNNKTKNKTLLIIISVDCYYCLSCTIYIKKIRPKKIKQLFKNKKPTNFRIIKTIKTNMNNKKIGFLEWDQKN